MLSRLVDNDIAIHRNTLDIDKINWWLCECRNPTYLVELCQKYPDFARQQFLNRPLLRSAIKAEQKKLIRLLEVEREKEQAKDRAYWEPLKKELESLRHKI